MISFLPLLMGFKQCFDNLGGKLTDYIKCRSNCCYQVNVYDPKNCAVMNGASNRFIRAITPDCVRKSNASKDEFVYTPKK